MQLQFEKQEIPSLATVKREVQTQEQTQELRISDGMPDIGSVVGAWGQVILRTKEWQGDAMAVTGGTMVWVQYLPEEGGEPCSVESWLPFQMRWNLPESQRDGIIMAKCDLLGVDARSTSARKMMLKANVAVLAWAMEEREYPIFTPEDVPQDVQLQVKTYPVMLPREAGEKAFSLEETVNLPPSAPKLEKLLSYCLQPEINEEKLMGDKLVFRGMALLHILYCADDGGEYAWDFQLPFTQYSELDREYGEDAESTLWPCVTALEAEKGEDGLQIKAGMVCQYRILHRPLIQVVQDAYSPRRSVTPVRQDSALPGILEQKEKILHSQVSGTSDAMRLTDTMFRPFPVMVDHGEDSGDLQLKGRYQWLYYDMEGILRTGTQMWETGEPLLGERENITQATLWPVGMPQGNLMSGSVQLSSDGKLMTETVCGQPIPMVSALELGELQEADPLRPSLILRRAEGQDLWQLAKNSGSTVPAIQEANHLTGEPEDSQILLIPVL